MGRRTGVEQLTLNEHLMEKKAKRESVALICVLLVLSFLILTRDLQCLYTP